MSSSYSVTFLKSHSEKHIILCTFKNPHNYLILYVSYMYIHIFMGDRSAKTRIKLIAIVTSGEQNHIRRGKNEPLLYLYFI